MIIWLVGVFLVALAGGIGYFMGGIRSAVCLIGTVVAAFLADTVGGWMVGLLPLIGFKNPLWQFYLPPLLGFLVVSFVFLLIALVPHRLTERHYRNSTDEYTYARWFRLNRRTGAAIGACLGTVWLILLGVLAYVPGYLTTQLADAEENSMSLRLANSLTHGMESTGLQRVVERFQPADEEHYIASDIIGLVYNNPALHSRLASYPPFLGLAEKPEIAELARDPEVNTLIQSRAGLTQILENPRMRAVTDNHEIVNELLALDLRDLNAYLRTGVSEKFKDELILGRWRLNVRRSIAEMKIVGSERIPAVEFNLLRRALNVYLDQMTLGFTTDNRALLKVRAKDEAKLMQVVGRPTGITAAPAGSAGDPSAPPPAVGTGSGMTARSLVSRAIPQQTAGNSDVYDRYGISGGMADRYGTAGGGGGAQSLATPLASTTSAYVPRQPTRSSPTTVLAPLMSSLEGTWSRSGEDYTVTFPADGGSLALDTKASERQLVAVVDGRTLVFDRM
jgi:hypothetical protein